MNGKWVYLGQRNLRLSREQFVERWLAHRRIGTLPEMVAEFVGATYGAVRSDTDMTETISSEYDAVGLFALKGLHSIPTIAGILKRDYIQADELRFFIRTSDQFSMFCAEDVVLGGPETKAVAVMFLRRKRELGPGAFIAEWRERHQAAVKGSALAGKVVRYVQNTVIAPPPPGFGYDAIAELWFDDADAMTAAAPAIDALMRETETLDWANSTCILTDIVMCRPRSD